MCLAVIYPKHVRGFRCACVLEFCFAAVVYCLARACHNDPDLDKYHGLL